MLSLFATRRWTACIHSIKRCDFRNPSTRCHKAVSEVSAHGKVREELVAVQRKIGERGGVVMDGRDIGTAVLRMQK
nr:(d)CMP kinase [Enterococcus faecium]